MLEFGPQKLFQSANFPPLHGCENISYVPKEYLSDTPPFHLLPT